jgi:ABC-type antimicrobial peptide transport system permease subunit
MTSVFLRRHPAVTAVGVMTGVWLGGCSFVIAHASDAILAPSSLLIMVWFAMLAGVHRPGPRDGVEVGAADGRALAR